MAQMVSDGSCEESQNTLVLHPEPYLTAADLELFIRININSSTGKTRLPSGYIPGNSHDQPSFKA